VEDAGKMLGSLALNNEVEVLGVEAYKKLLENTERRNRKLTSLEFEIEYNEKRWDSLKALRPVKKEPVEVSCSLCFIELEFQVFIHFLVCEVE
jgi:sentrin-specific protease 1